MVFIFMKNSFFIGFFFLLYPEMAVRIARFFGVGILGITFCVYVGHVWCFLFNITKWGFVDYLRTHSWQCANTKITADNSVTKFNSTWKSDNCTQANRNYLFPTLMLYSIGTSNSTSCSCIFDHTTITMATPTLHLNATFHNAYQP